MHPNAAAPVPDRWIVFPREVEGFVPAQLRTHHELNMREGAVIEVSRETGVVGQCAHGYIVAPIWGFGRSVP